MNSNIIEVFQVYNLEAMVKAQNSIIQVKQGIDNGLLRQKLDDMITIIRTSLHSDIISIFKPLQNEGQPESIKEFFKDVNFNSIHQTVLNYFDKEVQSLPRK